MTHIFHLSKTKLSSVLWALLIASCNGDKAPDLPTPGSSTTKATSGDSKVCLKMVGGTEVDTPAIFIIASPFLIPAKANMYEFCTATWVSHNWAITAAHCITDPALTKPKTYALAPRKITTALAAGQALASGIQALRVIRPSDIYGSGDDPKSATKVPNTFDVTKSDHINKDVAYLEFPPGTGKSFLAINSGAKPAVGASVSIAGFGVRSFADASKDFFAAGGAFPQKMDHKITALPSNIDPALYSNMLYISNGSTGKGIPLPGDSGGPMISSGKIIGIAVVYFNNPGQNPAAMYASLNGSKVVTVTNAAKAAGLVFGEKFSLNLNVTGATATIPDLVDNLVPSGSSSSGGAASGVTYPNSATTNGTVPNTATGTQTADDCIEENNNAAGG